MLSSARAERLRHLVRRHLLDALDERGLALGSRLEFPLPGCCSVTSFEESFPGPGELLVQTIATVVSAGTERALYLQLENTSAEYPLVPGYSQCGSVVAVGSGTGLQVGQRVVTTGPHASFCRVRASEAVPISQATDPQQAAMAGIAVIALQGVRKARIEAGERVAVLGCGIVGQLAAQFAQLAGGRVTALATSPQRLAVARACGIRTTLDVREDPDRLATFDAAVVIDATGHPAALHGAIKVAAPGARVVLLGSSRGVSREVDLSLWRRKGLHLVGAHTANVPSSDGARAWWTWRRECEAFAELLAAGRLTLGPLISRRAAPSEAPQVYADLARSDDRSVAIVFEWTRPGPWCSRIEKASPLRAIARGLRRVAGRAHPAPAYLPASSDGRRVRFGLIGCGEIAVASAAALRAAVNATITRTFDIDPRLAQDLAAGTPCAAATALEQVLDDPAVDAVLLSVPHHLHAPLAIQAAQAGKHVVVEKPMATNYPDCIRMIDAARRAGVLLSVCYTQRYDPRVQRAKRLIEAGALGELVGTRIVFGQHRGTGYWTGGLTGRTHGDWRSRLETAGGGVLMMNACHMLDAVGWLAQDTVAEVMACTASLYHRVEVEDSVSLTYRYERGALGSLQATTGLVGPAAYEQVLWGRHGQLVVAPKLRLWSERTIAGYEAGRWHSAGPIPLADERRHFFEAFCAAVLHGSKLPVEPEEAAEVQATLAAAYRAAESGRRQSIASLKAETLSLGL